MSSGPAKQYEKEQFEEQEKDQNWLKDYSVTISVIDVGSTKFKELKWMVDNADKIIRNKKLIDLIG